MSDEPNRPEPDDLATEGAFGRWKRTHGPRQDDPERHGLREPNETTSSRLTPDDRIANERRSKPRRREDVARIEALQRRFAFGRRIALTAVTAWAIVATVGLLVVALYAQREADASRKASAASQQSAAAARAASAASRQAASAKQLTAAIQAERHRSILENCRAQNKHHRDTVQRLGQIDRKLPPAQRAMAERRARYTVLLIDSLQPLQPCAALAAKQTSSTKPHPPR